MQNNTQYCDVYFGICSNSDLSNLATIELEITLGILLAIGIGGYFYHLEKQRRNKRQQYALFQLRPLIESLIANLRIIERMVRPRINPETGGRLTDPHISICQQILDGMKPTLQNVDNTLQILQSDIDPETLQKINGFLNNIRLYSDNIHQDIIFPPTTMIDTYTELIELIKKESEKFRQNLIK